MAEEIVRIIKVDTKNSGKSIKDLRNEIKALRTELEKTEVGSEEFSAALKKLTQTQKEYNSVQQQVRDMSRTNQQDMVQFASFARNLGKAYSSLNAAIGLFADKNEDVQRAMLRVQRTIQLVQGLDGIAGLVRDIPKVLAGFRNWLTALDPIEKQVNNIVKGINGVDPAKLRDITEANRLAAEAAKAPTTTATVGGGTRQFIPTNNEELEKATKTYYPALLQQEKDLLQVRKSLEAELDGYNNTLKEVTKKETDFLQALLTGYTKTGHTVQDVMNLMNQYKDKPSELVTNLASIPDVAKEANKALEQMGYSLNDLVNQNIAGMYADASKAAGEASAKIAEVDVELKAVQAEIEAQELGMTKLQKVIAKTGVVGRTAFTMIKTALASIGIGLLIAGIVKLLSYIGQAISKTQEWVRINKEIATSTNQIASKSIVVLKELSIAYGKVGDSADAKKEFIEKYNDKIKETGIAIDDVKKAEDVFINNTDKYVAAITARAKAQATEQQAIKLYQEYLDKRYELENQIKWWQQGLTNMAVPESREAVAEDFIEKNRQKNAEAIEKLDQDIEEKLKKLFESVAEFDKEYSGIFASIKVEPPKDDPKYKEWLAQKEKDLETLKKANEDALQVFMDDIDKELQAVTKHYDELIELAKKYGQDTALLEVARQKEIDDIMEKYAQKDLDDQKKRLDEQYQLIQTEIERIRKMNDTSNLRQPREQTFQTVYKGNGVMPFGIQKNWVNVYQSKEDVENQYKAQIEYNNKVYEITKQRIEQENELLKKQLEIEGLDADKRLEIQRTLAENEMALSDAKLDNEQANLDAYLAVQEKKKAALDGVLDVASTSLNAMSNIFKTEAQIHQTESQDLTKSQEEREKAAKKMESAMAAYKAFAITQAIVDTWKSANEAYAAMASIPYVGPALGIAASAAAVLSGMANVRAIMSESMTSQSQSSSVTAPSAMQAPPIEYTRTLVGDKELDEINQPIRCYVLESDISKTQNKVKVTEQNATF